MNMKKLHSMRSMVKSALTVSGMAATLGLCTVAHAQDMEFAQKLLGAPSGETSSMQFRSTIIDPSRGKLTATNNPTLRVIPINNPDELAGQDRACSICGVVESISITLRERAGADAYDDGALEDIAARYGKVKNGLAVTRSGAQMSPDAGKGSKKPATMYEVKVRMTNGTFRVVNETRQPDYTVGDYVRVISGAVTAA